MKTDKELVKQGLDVVEALKQFIKDLIDANKMCSAGNMGDAWQKIKWGIRDIPKKEINEGGV